MNYKSATNEQLYTIVYHEVCSPAEKLLALMELRRRDKHSNGRMKQTRIKRKMA